MNFYKLLIAQFKLAARSTIFSPRQGSDSDMVNENYYCHVLINYTPIVMKETFDEFGVGIGIFSMQGIERRNKESKNCAS